MMMRAVVSVATTPHYQKGMERLSKSLAGQNVNRICCPGLPLDCPSHSEVPYAFKAYALNYTAEDCDLLLWCDASILPIRSLEPLWEKIERDGYWIARNGWNNYQWTADGAYPDLFSEELKRLNYTGDRDGFMDDYRSINKGIPHVVATAFGLNVQHPIGQDFLNEYYRLASETRAFCGPWKNTPRTPCGPADVLGHRHDQAAASVIAWRLGMKLTDCPEIFAYSKRRQDGTLHLSDQDERTILLADGKMEDGVVL